VVELRDLMVDEFVKLVQIDAESGHEGPMADAVEAKLVELGLEVGRDDAGNVIGRLAGPRVDGSWEPIILCAHLDRVVPGNGVSPVVEDGAIRSSGDTVLGADDVAGIVAILAGLRLALEAGAPLPPVETVFTVGEEEGLRGSRLMDYFKVKAKRGYVFDAAGPVGTVIVGSPTHVDLDVTITGRAAHAAINPEDGISAIQIAAEAMANLPFGRIDQETTANIGVVAGGVASNIVCDKVKIQGEVRCLVHDRAVSLSDEFAEVFKAAANRRGGSAEIVTWVKYQCYRVPDDSPTVERARRAIEKLGRKCVLSTTMGGSDANMFNLHRIESVCMGMGFEQVHSCRETMPISELEAAGNLVRELILAEEQSR
jgi:tripeptide aminopeptidase